MPTISVPRPSNAEPAADPDLVLRIQSLHTQFRTRARTVRAVDGVDLEVRRGETLGIVGESGSGKSLTALSIMRLVPEPAGRIVSGHIWFEGEDLVAKSQREMTAVRGRKIAIIPQDPMTSLNPAYTVGRQLMESIKLTSDRSKKDAKDFAEYLLHEVGISDPQSRMLEYPHQLSGGMRQRVVGAIALAGDPSILIADEPTTSLDATIQLQYLEFLQRQQAKDGRLAIIFITHDLGIVAKLCHRVAVMYAGKVVENASIDELARAASHPYTRALLESIPPIDRDVDLLPTIAGAPPGPDSMPTGCRFSPRCPLVIERCMVELPPLLELGRGHSARCWRLTDMEGRLR